MALKDHEDLDICSKIYSVLSGYGTNVDWVNSGWRCLDLYARVSHKT